MRIAVIGGGIAGLGAAKALDRRADVTLYEAESRIGGHTYTVDVPRDGRAPLPVDTGFIIYNERTYPLFSALVRELGVATRPTDMSFSSTCGRCRLELGTRGLAPLRLPVLLAGMLRFFRAGQRAVARNPQGTLGAWIHSARLPRDAVDHFVVPMGAAIWSTSTRELLDMPAATFLRFYANHGMMSVTGAPRWRTIVGGSKTYVAALLARFGGEVRRDAPVARVRRDGAGVSVELAGGDRRRFDRAVIATHSDQALALLGDDATADERRVLGAIRYTPNDAYLHRDTSFLPSSRLARASWNHQTDDCRAPRDRVGVTYWMNLLQGLPGPEDWLVTLNPTRPPRDVVARIAYAHPLYDDAAIRAQRELPSLQGRGGVWFAGAYHGYGFHEDGYRSGLAAAAGALAAAEERAVA